MVNEMRPIVARQSGSRCPRPRCRRGRSVAHRALFFVSPSFANGGMEAPSRLQPIRFSSIQKPMLTDNQEQVMLPLQAQQLGRSYNGKLLVNVEITVRDVANAEESPRTAGVRETRAVAPELHQAEVQNLCVGEIPILVGSCLCHQSTAPNHGSRITQPMPYFIVNGRGRFHKHRTEHPPGP